MSRLADPTACPDCRALLVPGDPEGPEGLEGAASRCPACGLVLRGPLAAELWRTMVHADLLVRRLRSEPAPVLAVRAPGGRAPALEPPAAPARPAVTGRSVSVVLLALGGLCLLVFAVIFLGVTWSVLGLAGRSLVMAGITAGLVALAAGLTRRGLRASAETSWLVAGGTLVLDVHAASAAGLLGPLQDRATSTVAGLALVVVGAVAARWSARAATGLLVAPQGLSVLGLALATAIQVGGRGDLALAATVALPVALLGALGARQLGLRVASLGSLAVAGALWAVLVGSGLDRAWVVSAPGAWWWPLVAAAAWLAATVELLERRDLGRPWARSVVTGLALLPLALALASPALTHGSTTASVLLGTLTLILLLVLVVLARTPWAVAAAGLACAVATVLLVWLAASPAAVSLAARAHPVAWLVLGVALAAAVPVLLGAVGGLVGDQRLPRQLLAPTGPPVALGCVLLGGWAALLALRPDVAVAVAAGLLATALTATGAWWWRGRRPTASAIAATCAAWTGALSVVHAARVPGEPLLAIALSVLALPLLAAGLTLDRAGRGRSSAAVVGTGSLLGCAAVVAWSDQAGLDAPRGAVVLAAYAVALVVVAAVVPRLPLTRLVAQVAAATPVLVALAATGDDASAATRTLAVVATGTAAGVLLQRLRGVPTTVLAPVTVAVAMVAAGWRGVAGLSAPELASLPAGLLLVGTGLLVVVADRRTASAPALLPGLVAAVLPSALLALGDPVSVRGAAVALVAALLVATGVGARLGAPFLLGAVVSTLLVLAHLEPVAAAVPRWLVIGVVGGVLLTAGITWESGLRRLAGARHYVASLR